MINKKNKSIYDDEDLNLVFSIHNDKKETKKNDETVFEKMKKDDPYAHLFVNNHNLHPYSSHNTIEKEDDNYIPKHSKRHDSLDNYRANNGEEKYKTYSGFYGLKYDDDYNLNGEKSNTIANRPTNGMDKDETNNGLDIYDWNNPDNCSEREWLDDDDYDDFDNT